MIFLYLTLVSLGLLGSLFLSLLYKLKVNYDAARRTGLPIIILPFDGANPLWMVLDRKVTSWVRRIPFCAGNFTRFNWRGWEIKERYRAHQELGDALLFVTPGRIYLHTCDAKAVQDIFARRLDFDRPAVAVAMLNVFGPNLGTAEGQQWQKHRKATASCFNESVYSSVWSESVRQATGMIRYWSSLPTVSSTADDTRTVSLHVMSSAVFGKTYSFRSSTADVDLLNLSDDDTSASYGDALRIILDRCIPLLVLGQKNLGNSWLPRSFKELHRATVIFKDHMSKAYEEEKRVMDRGGKQSHNLITSLVRSSRGGVDGSSRDALTEEEVYGNIFVYNFAGHDATANSLAFGVFLISTRPHIQEWIAEEINHVLGDTESDDSVYEKVFPRLKRCLAVTHETVRLYTAVGIAKEVGDVEQPLDIAGKRVMLPKNTMIIPNYSALHTHPRYWGSDSLEFKPSRWIESKDVTSQPVDGDSLGAVLDAETFVEPARNSGSFVGWSGGVRACPGRKFSQVEFVGVLVGLFRHFKVKPALRPGETDAAARTRFEKFFADDVGFRLLLQVLHPQQAVLEWALR